MAHTDGVRLADAAAEGNGLACMVAELLRENLANHPERRRDLAALGVPVGLVAKDAEVSLTLDFRGRDSAGDGEVVIRDGLAPATAIVITTDSERITKLTLLPLRFGLPVLTSKPAREVLADVLAGRLSFRGRGLLTHPLALLRLTRLLNVA